MVVLHQVYPNAKRQMPIFPKSPQYREIAAHELGHLLGSEAVQRGTIAELEINPNNWLTLGHVRAERDYQQDHRNGSETRRRTLETLLPFLTGGAMQAVWEKRPFYSFKKGKLVLDKPIAAGMTTDIKLFKDAFQNFLARTKSTAAALIASEENGFSLGDQTAVFQAHVTAGAALAQQAKDFATPDKFTEQVFLNGLVAAYAFCQAINKLSPDLVFRLGDTLLKQNQVGNLLQYQEPIYRLEGKEPIQQFLTDHDAWSVLQHDSVTNPIKAFIKDPVFSHLAKPKGFKPAANRALDPVETLLTAQEKESAIEAAKPHPNPPTLSDLDSLFS